MRKLIPTTSLGGEEWLVLIDGGNKDNRLDDCYIFKSMEGSNTTRNLGFATVVCN